MVKHLRRVAVAVALLALWFPAREMAQGTPPPFVAQQYFDNSGNPCSGCLLNFYAAGSTTTRQATYSDVTLVTPNTNPVVLNSAGRPTSNYIYLSATSYHMVMTDAAGATTYFDVDNTPAIPSTSVGVDISSQTAGQPLVAGNCAYVSDGSGGRNAGQWYQCDSTNAYSSSAAPMVGIVTTSIASGASGTIRIGGRATGLVGLTSGTVYYAGAAGALTATAPTNQRAIGAADTTTTLVFSDHGYASIIARSLRINAATPFTWLLPAADAAGFVKSDGSGNISLDSNPQNYQLQTTTATGTQNNFAVTAARRLLLRCNNATAVTFTGFAAGTDGDVIDVVSVGAGQVNFTPNSGGSSVGNKFTNIVTTGNTPLAAGSGTARYIYDGTAAVWRLVQHEQGAWISVTYAAGNFTAGAGAWTVDAGDQTAFKFWLRGRTLSVFLDVDNTTVSMATTDLITAVPNGFVPTNNQFFGHGAAIDNGATREVALVVVSAGGSIIARRVPGTNWSVATNTTNVQFANYSFEVN